MLRALQQGSFEHLQSVGRRGKPSPSRGCHCPAHSGCELTLPGVFLLPLGAGSWCLNDRVPASLQAGRPPTCSLDSIAFVLSWSPPVFLPQMGRSTERPRLVSACFVTNCDISAPESSVADPVELLHHRQQPGMAEHLAPGLHSMNP